VLLVATRKEVTTTYLDTFRMAGLQVDIVEINSFALIRTIETNYDNLHPKKRQC